MLCLNIIAWITNYLWYACAVLLITMVAAHLQLDEKRTRGFALGDYLALSIV